MTASPYGSYTNDLLGNRSGQDTSGDDPRHTWDLLNRMLTYRSDDGLQSGVQTTYTYRADGMRVTKTDTWVSPSETTKFYYDGQMGVQDTLTVTGGDTTVTKYGIGARGIDVITKKVNSGSEQFGYPLYDPDFGSGAGTHGNMVATLARSGSNSYSTGNAQSYDVWGGVRSGSSTEDQGYVANLGHRHDSESSLTYMRARYYEPSTGRFVSEDPSGDGFNWYTYCYNQPSSRVDASGELSVHSGAFFVMGVVWGLLAWNNLQAEGSLAVALNAKALARALKGRIKEVANIHALIAIACFSLAVSVEVGDRWGTALGALTSALGAIAEIVISNKIYSRLLSSMTAMRSAAKVNGIGNMVTQTYFIYGLAVFGALIAIEAFS